MKAKIFSTLILMALIFSTMNAQNNKIDGALAGFLRTPFMQKFKDLKTEAETTVKHFKQISGQYPQMEVRKVERGYMLTADRANGLLKSIIQDFTNPKTMKGISKFPESYAKGLELDIYQLSDFYAQNFQQPLADVTGNQVDGSPILIVLAQLVGMTKNMVEHINQTRIANRKYSESYLRQHLYEPYHFKAWNEIGNGGYYNNQSWDSPQNNWNDNSGGWDQNDNSGWDNSGWDNNNNNNWDNSWDNNQNNNNNWDNSWDNTNNNNQNQNNQGWDNNWNQNTNQNNNQNNNWNNNTQWNNQNNQGWNNTQNLNSNQNNNSNWTNPGNPNSTAKDSTKQTKPNSSGSSWNFTPKKQIKEKKKGSGNHH